MLEPQFAYISQLIDEARSKAFAAINQQLVQLYWQIGEYVSRRVEAEEWGKQTVEALAAYLQNQHPGLKGFGRRSLFRMKQFYETYREEEKVSALLTQISWTHHINILSKTKTLEEKEFYIRLAIKERLSSRELIRHLNSAYFERVLLADQKLPPSLQELPQQVSGHLKDTYVFEFLNLPKVHSEQDLKKALLHHLKDFLLELGKDYSYLGEEYRLQVGLHDYAIDLLFYHRELQCLVCVELKIQEFKPEFLGKLNFYLEALDRDVKKEHENPSIGILLCKGKDEEVVEYAMSRNISPAMIADYSTKLIDKERLRKKLHELFEWQENLEDSSKE